MKHIEAFLYRDGVLHADGVPVPQIIESVGTPTYIYSASAIRTAYRRLEAAFSPLGVRFQYAVKSSPNLHLCRLMHDLGAGMDVVSGGELDRAWLAGARTADMVFAGVGKTDEEIRSALDGRFHTLEGVPGLEEREPERRGPVGILNAESISELERIAYWGNELGVRPRVCLRVNPDVDPHTHEYTTTGKEENKFGIDAPLIPDIFDTWGRERGVDLVGLHVHIGSPVPTVEPYAEAVEALLNLIDELERRGSKIEVLDLGGGWPMNYVEEQVPPLEDYAERLVPLLGPRVQNGLQVLMEPGRFIMANSGILVTRVQHVKKGRAKTFVICDAGMHSLIRPALYRAFHFLWPVAWTGEAPRLLEDPGLPGLETCDVVGPICETGDFLARDRQLPPMGRGELVAIFSAGAYGMSMVSNYNDHGRPAEVLVDGDRATMINERQPLATVLATEHEARELW
ncbi:MAG: diaminopimelate decarboxylase [Bacteroidia bacterium]|nr:diaminopimelate decarboxylase [Bacteroidia bacterium]